MQKRDSIRFIIATSIIAASTLLIVWRYTTIMLTNSGNSTQVITQPLMERGPILDREGRILAIQTRFESVTAWLPNVSDLRETAETLAGILGIDQSTLLSRMSAEGNYQLIQRKITDSQASAIRKQKADGSLRGISIETEYGRSYPGNRLASHILGFAGIENVGLEGIEYSFDGRLSPDSSEGSNGEVYGNQVYLTIDLNIQFAAERIARAAYERYRADSVMLLIMEAKTGDFLGYSAFPDFDPNTYGSFSTDARLNRPSYVAYEPGSVFKVFSIASMLELGEVGLGDTFYCNGFYEHESIPEAIRCLGVHGTVNAASIIKYSCNAGAAYASESVSEDRFYRKLRDFGFGERTYLPFPGESFGILSTPTRWSTRSKPTIAFGQEISTTAVQMVTAATAFANQGVLLRPHIVKKVVSPDGKVLESFGREPVRTVLSADTAKNMLYMMEEATLTDGTARRASVEGLRISAKTGTAQLYDPVIGSYSGEAFVASCLALFPTEDPSIIVYIVIDHPKGDEFFGGRIAAPIVKEVAEELVPYLGIPLSTENVVEHTGTITVPRRPPPSIGTFMPDLSGYSKREILPLLADTRFTITIEGEGWVSGQSPAPGTDLAEGAVIRLLLE